MENFVRLPAMLLGLLLALIGPAMAGDAEIAALRALLAPGAVDTDLFSADFLKAVPAAQIAAAVEPIAATIGPVTAITARGGPSYEIETATHELMADIVLDGSGKIAGLLLHPPVARDASIDDLLEQWTTAAPQAAWLITRNGSPIRSSGADTALAVGSAFKLGVLKALSDQIAAGTRQWSDVVTLTDADKSLPSGFLQTWPDGAPLTLHTLAALMISISDNTATDTLMRVVGRDRVEAALGIAPALTTRELFTLKASPALKARYQAGGLAARRAVLAEADALPLPDPSGVMTPHDAGLEWDLTPATLCRLMDGLRDLDMLQINPGIASKAQWRSVAFKGGSEIGVLSLVTAVTAKDGTRYCAAAIWNAPAALDETTIMGRYGGVLGKLARAGAD